MWHRLDRILGGRNAGRKPARCEACGEPIGPDPALVFERDDAGEGRRLCSPECLPSVWKKVESRRQKVSERVGRDRSGRGDKHL